jgi:lipopolysaccharide/colanic/teichoic acid biosynthesis glycosyltransferase
MSATTEVPRESPRTESEPAQAPPAAADAPAGPASPRQQDPLLRAADLAVATTVLAVTLPITAAVAATIRLLDGTPVLYRGERLGVGGVPFTMYKFRTLRMGAEQRLEGLYGDELQAAARE